MAESRRHYVWVAGWEDRLMATAARDAVAVAITRWSMRWKWFMGGKVTLLRGGKLRVEATIRGRDQWRVHERQTLLIAAVSAALRTRRASFGEPEVSRLPPHRNRGRLRTAIHGDQQAAQQPHDHEQCNHVEPSKSIDI